MGGAIIKIYFEICHSISGVSSSLGQAFIHQGACDLSLLPSPCSPGKLPETGRPGTPRAASVHPFHPHFGRELSPEPPGPVGSSAVEPGSGGYLCPRHRGSGPPAPQNCLSLIHCMNPLGLSLPVCKVK